LTGQDPKNKIKIDQNFQKYILKHPKLLKISKAPKMNGLTRFRDHIDLMKTKKNPKSAKIKTNVFRKVQNQ
jgi:hypothetical protein